MANDREILRIVWEGQLPVVFELDKDEISGLTKPEDFCLMVSRISYLPLVTDKVRKYFSRYVPNDRQQSEVWFDFNGIPLKWHYPIGLLFDLYRSQGDDIPWVLTMHFSKFPEEELVRFQSKDVVESFFMSCLKEADVLKHRGQVVSAMQKKDHTQLWLGLVNDKFDQFWAVNRRLMEPIGDQECFRHIPIRFYNEDGTYWQKLISPTNESGLKRTVEDLMNELSTSSKQIESIHTHGVEIPDKTPLQWLSEHMSYPDNFLHICVKYKAK
uniref:Autophagy protein 5 n=1 Tax=Tabanus bromius TaxID=304241 RepID=A0A0K8TSS0_TABBR